MHRAFATLVLLASSGCYFVQSTGAPLETRSTAAATSPAKGLIVFLPGMLDGPDDFYDNGFVAHVQSAHPEWSTIAANAHLRYYLNGSVFERVYEDVIKPARERGVERIWIVGISMAGVGTLGTAMRHEDDIEGVVLLAPYLGDGDVTDAVQSAGGPASWTPPASLDHLDDSEEKHSWEMWTWLKRYTTSEPPTPRILLGYGTDDDDGGELAMLGRVLGTESVATEPGGHDWPVWKPLFEKLLARALNP